MRRKVVFVVMFLSVFGLYHTHKFGDLNSFANANTMHGKMATTLSEPKIAESTPNLSSAGAAVNYKISSLIASTASIPRDSQGRKKVLYINSYHKGYVWSDGIESGLLKALEISENKDGSLNADNSPVALGVLRMNTKTNHSKEFIEQAVLEAREIISEWQPDVIIASDDNVSKYLISKYYVGSSIPFVFCAINVDPKSYGFGNNNVTGMIEKDYFEEVIELLKPYAKGSRIGYIGSDTLTEQSVIDTLVNQQNIKFTNSRLVSTFSEWMDAYKSLQDSVDMVVWLSPVGIKGWDEQRAIEFVNSHTKVPSGSTINSATSLALISQIKLAEEQGWWAGETALKILSGVSPQDIPIVSNEQSRLYLNMDLAKILDIVFPMELINKATFVSEESE